VVQAWFRSADVAVEEQGESPVAPHCFLGAAAEQVLFQAELSELAEFQALPGGSHYRVVRLALAARYSPDGFQVLERDESPVALRCFPAGSLELVYLPEQRPVLRQSHSGGSRLWKPRVWLPLPPAVFRDCS
jgi:hypothetical protein